jgi:hypothetical protein
MQTPVLTLMRVLAAVRVWAPQASGRGLLALIGLCELVGKKRVVDRFI